MVWMIPAQAMRAVTRFATEWRSAFYAPFAGARRRLIWRILPQKPSQAKEDFLREFLELPGGLPCHDTFSRLFRLMKPSAFEAFFAKFRTDFAADRDAQNTPSAIAIDGSPSTRKVGTTFRIS